jgi:hypothetical protein
VTIHNIHEYKKSLIIVKDLEKILKILGATEASLKQFDKYRPVQYILQNLVDNKPILELYLEKYRIIRDTRGQNSL